MSKRKANVDLGQSTLDVEVDSGSDDVRQPQFVSYVPD